MRPGFDFEDFTLKNYTALLKSAKRRYKFISYKEAGSERGRFIVLRHDIDFSPDRALLLARIEKGLGIKTTYCLQLASPFYNLFEKEVRDMFLNITKLGHAIGIHFDPAPYGVKKVKDIRDCILFEKGILKRLLGCRPEVLSFHNPGGMTPRPSGIKIEKMVNTYCPFFTERMEYISDSNGYWRFQGLKEALSLKRHDRLHVLIHPAWWQDLPMSPWMRIKKVAQERRDSAIDGYKRLLFKAGRANIGYEGDTVR